MDEEQDSPSPISSDDAVENAQETPTREPVTLETALTWLAKIKPVAVLALLRDPDFALVSVTAFAGFRVNATGYTNPLVRRRLAQEAIRDEKFADRLQALAAPSPPSSGTPPPSERERGQWQKAVTATHEGNTESDPAKTAMSGSHKPLSRSEGGGVPDEGGEGAEKRLADLRAERDRRRHERDEARQALAEAEATRQEAERRKRQAETERDEASRQAQRQAQRIARLERQVAKLQIQQTSLLRALKQQETAAEAAGETQAEAETAAPIGMGRDRTDPWQDAVAHLLDKRRYDVALGLAEDVLRAAPDDIAALEIAAQAQAARGDVRGAVMYFRRRLTAALARGERAEAGESLLRLLLLTPSESERDLRVFLTGLRTEDTASVEGARTILARLRGVEPETYSSIAAQITRLVPAALAETLMPPSGLWDADAPLPLGLPGNISARRLLQAVDTGNVGLVEAAREALGQLCRTNREIQKRARLALERAAGDDPSALVPLLSGKERGPVVVDGSNAAWFDQESLSSGHPRLRPLLELRRALRARGYFPVLLYADAPLPYTIDAPGALREMIARGEIVLVDSGVDADEVLLREAKRYEAPLVTNDYMTDWDPNNEVPKIRYTLSLHGEAYLLSES